MRMEVRPLVAESRARMMLLSVIESREDVASSNTLRDSQGDHMDVRSKRRKRLSVYYKQLCRVCSVLQSIRYLTLLYLILTKIGREVAIFCKAKFHFQLI